MQTQTQGAITEENSNNSILKKLNWYQETVISFYRKNGRTEKLSATAGINLFACFFPHPRPTAQVLIVTGYNESSLKYAETIFNLHNLGFSVSCFDHRGQGQSDRYPEQDGKSYVDRFQTYIDDMEILYLWAQKKNKENNTPVFILSHSMGATITTLALAQQKIRPAGVILSSPFFELGYLPFRILESAFLSLSTFMFLLGREKKMIWGAKKPAAKKSFEKNDVTHSKARYLIWSQHISENPLLQLEGPTFAWTREILQAIRLARNTRLEKTTPVLLLQAGEDSVVQNRAQEEFLSLNPQCQKLSLQDAKHEILMECDMVREKAFRAIQEFIASVLQ